MMVLNARMVEAKFTIQIYKNRNTIEVDRVERLDNKILLPQDTLLFLLLKKNLQTFWTSLHVFSF